MGCRFEPYLWSQFSRGLSRISHGVPALREHDGKVELVTEAGDVVQGFNFETGERLWSSQVIGEGKVPSMLYLEPHLFAITDGGIATCLKAATGEIVWQERVGGNFSASPVTAEGRIYLVSDEGETTVIEAGPEFKVLARNPLGEKVQASPAVSQGQIFIRTEKHLFCIGAK
jgi:outer membrane protein assembly factor BamB